MPQLDAQDTYRLFGGENPPQLCFLCGEDSLTVAKLEQKILKKLTDGGDLADSVFDGQELNLDRLLDACAFSPMFQPYNVVIIRDLAPDALSDAQWKTLSEALEDLPACVVVMISMRSLPVYELKRGVPQILPKYKKITGFFEKKGVLCICAKKDAVTLGKSIMERAKRHGSDITRVLAEELANRCLCDSTLIQSELDKLLACANGEPITAEMLDALTAKLPDADVFQMAKAVTAGRGAEALSLLNMLTAKAEDSKTILGILSILSSNFVDLYRAKTAMASGIQADRMAEEFAYPKNRAFAVKYAFRDARLMGVAQLRTCVRILRDTDKACKSTRTPPRLLLEQAIVRMLRVDKNGNEY